MDDILGGRDDMSGYGGRAGFTTFARIFTGFLCVCCFCLFFVAFGLVLGCLVSAGEKTPAFRFHSFCSCKTSMLTDYAPCSLGNAGKKSQLQDTEDAYRAAHPSWMDLDVAPDDIKKQWQEANDNRRMQFKVGVYKDSNIRMLTGTIKADWIQLPVERYLTALPTLKQGVISGVFKNKGAAPWAITRAEKLQLSVFLPNNLSLDDWYAGVYALPTVWPDVSMLGANNLRRVVGYDFHHLRKKYDVLSMWGNIHPQWRLLQQHLETKGPFSPSEREERLFTNRSNRPGDDMKDELRTDGDPIAWRAWSTAQNQLWQLRQPAPPLEFPGEQGMFIDLYAQVREEEQVISPQFTRGQQDVSMRRRKKRKQVEDGTSIV